MIVIIIVSPSSSSSLFQSPSICNCASHAISTHFVSCAAILFGYPQSKNPISKSVFFFCLLPLIKQQWFYNSNLNQSWFSGRLPKFSHIRVTFGYLFRLSDGPYLTRPNYQQWICQIYMPMWIYLHIEMYILTYYTCICVFIPSSAYLYVHIYMYIYIYVRMYVCVCVYIHIYIYIYIYMRACMHACMDVLMYGCMDVCMYV